MSQLGLLPREDPDALVAKARELYDPVASFCLFSGGGDSLVTAHRCREHYDELAWLDTGTALPGVREHIERVAADVLEKPLRILEHEFDAFRLLVLGGEDWKGDVWRPFGFPGPPQHGRAYNRLKERLIEQLLRDAKVGQPRAARVMFLTGIRRAESQRRKSRKPINKKRAQVFVNPLIDWPDDEMRRYREQFGLPLSDVSALLHRSGECNCGAFAAPGEREMIQSLYPEWWRERIEPLEREAAELGIPCATWGQSCAEAPAATSEGDLCHECQLSLA